jgi:hypothetical protein
VDLIARRSAVTQLEPSDEAELADATKFLGEIVTNVTISGDVSGQLAVGENILQMHVSGVGNLVTVLPAGTSPTVTTRPCPIRLMPSRPILMVDRHDETASIVAEISAGRPVEISGPPGIGKSTLLKHLAHDGGLDEVCGGVAHLSAEGQSRDDLLQCLFDMFYDCDVHYRPGRGKLRHYLQDVRAALLLDDVQLSDNEISEIEDFAPQCGFVVAAEDPHPLTGALSVQLGGLPAEYGLELLAHALGGTLSSAEQEAAEVLCLLSGGAPGSLRHLAAAARQFDGTLSEFAAVTARFGPPPVRVESDADRRVLGLLAALPGIQLDLEQMAAITGLPDLRGKIDRWIAWGWVLAAASSASTATTYRLSPDVRLHVLDASELDDRRAELRAYFLRWAQEHRGVVLTSAERVATIQRLTSAAARRRDWRYLLALGALLDAAYALAGRWDAWRNVAQVMLEAARSIGDRRAESMALHQLGTRALCSGDVTAATGFLTAALDLRVGLGDAVAARVTRHNLSLIVAAPPVPPATPHEGGAARGQDDPDENRFLTRLPAAIKVLAILAPMAAGLVFITSDVSGTESPQLQLSRRALTFGPQAIYGPGQAQAVLMSNVGQAAVHVDAVEVTGQNREDFVVTEKSCRGELSAGGACRISVVFAPMGRGDREAVVAIRARELTADLVLTLAGSGQGMDLHEPAITSDSTAAEPTTASAAAAKPVTTPTPTAAAPTAAAPMPTSTAAPTAPAPTPTATAAAPTTAAPTPTPTTAAPTTAAPTPTPTTAAPTTAATPTPTAAVPTTAAGSTDADSKDGDSTDAYPDGSTGGGGAYYVYPDPDPGADTTSQ